MTHLPIPGGDDNTWGYILNDFLEVSLSKDGHLKTQALLKAGGVTSVNDIKPINGNITLDISSTGSALSLGGDLGGTNTLPIVSSTHLLAPLPINQGGTGSSAQNFIDLTSNQTVGGTKTFKSVIEGSISGNAATVTTNANLTGPIISDGNSTTVANQTGSGETFVMNDSPTLTGIPLAPTATNGTNNTQIATTAFVEAAVTGGGAPDATSSTPGLVQLDGDLGGTYNSPTVVSTHLASALPVNQGGTGSTSQNFVDLTTNQTIAGTKTFSSTIAGSISGNAATVTTNANLTGDVTSVGNTTTLTDSANVQSIISENVPAATFTTAGIDKQTVYNVKDYGATGNGTTDDSTSVANATSAASSTGGIVYFPQGTYKINTTLRHQSGKAVIFRGAGRSVTQLICGSSGMNLLDIGVDYDVVEHLTLDTQTNNCQAAIVPVANYTTLQHCIIKGGSNIFAIYYAGPNGATAASPLYNYGNRVIDVEINDLYQGDGFSWSFQASGFVKDIVHTGSRISIYICIDLEIDGYFYTVGSQSSGTNGWYITAPSSNISISNYISNGPGGIISSSTTYNSTNISLSNFYVNATGNNLVIGDVNGLQLTSINLANDCALYFEPDAAATNILVSNSSIPQINFGQGSGIDITNLYVDNVYFPAFTAGSGQNGHSFVNYNGNPATFSVEGGRTDNAVGFAFGSNNTYKVHNLDNLNPVRLYSAGTVTGATTFNRTSGDTQTATLTGNITVTLTSGQITGDNLTLILTQDGSGGRTISWPGNAVFGFGGTFVASTAAGAVDSITFVWDGTDWREKSRAPSRTLSVAEGGTGASTLTGLVVGNGTSAMTTVTGPAGTIVGTSDTQTLSNKQINRRVVALTFGATITPNCGTTDIGTVTLTGNTTMEAPSGTPVAGQLLTFQLIQDSTGSRLVTWTSGYTFGADVPSPTLSTGTGKTDYIGFSYNAINSVWNCVAIARGY